MESFAVKNISASTYFSKATYLDTQFIISAPEMPLTAELLKTIHKWDFSDLLSDGEPHENKPAMIIAEEKTKETEKVVKKNVRAELSASGDQDKIIKAELFYKEFQNYIKRMFSLLMVRNDLEFKPVADKIKELCIFIQENRRFLLRTEWLTDPTRSDNQLVSHTVRSTIIALIIGISMKLQQHRLIELGISALLHEIGMLKLPQENYKNNKELSDQDRKLLYAHPILGFNLLKSLKFPLEVSIAALEHHERENGTGYPQRKTGDKLSIYSKIIAVACSYEAIISSRPHKRAKDSHTAIMELLKNEGKQYDDTIVRAMVQSLSIYPIGLYVLLSDESKGQVVDIRQEDLRYPVVQIFGEILPNGKNKTIQTSQDSAYIVRPLTREEIEKLNET